MRRKEMFMKKITLQIFVAFSFLCVCEALVADEDGSSQKNSPALRMTVDDLEITVANLDENYQRDEGVIRFNYAEKEVMIVTDENSDRMRIIVPVLPASQLNTELLYRVMQANYDSSLDARYAIGNGILWSTFIHRLSSLTETDFLSGIGQTINTADSFGTSFSSGQMVFGGGDTNAIRQRQLIDQLQKEGRSI